MTEEGETSQNCSGVSYVQVFEKQKKKKSSANYYSIVTLSYEIGLLKESTSLMYVSDPLKDSTGMALSTPPGLGMRWVQRQTHTRT